MESGRNSDDLVHNVEKDEIGSAVRSELADEGMTDPNSTSYNNKVATNNSIVAFFSTLGCPI